MDQTHPALLMKKSDYTKISNLVSSASPDVQDFLQTELDRATVLDDDQFPNDVVSMNSKVTYVDLETNKETTVTLVYPEDANIEQNKISILAPVGAALIGIKIGQSIRWPLREGVEKTIKVIGV